VIPEIPWSCAISASALRILWMIMAVLPLILIAVLAL